MVNKRKIKKKVIKNLKNPKKKKIKKKFTGNLKFIKRKKTKLPSELQSGQRSFTKTTRKNIKNNLNALEENTADIFDVDF